MIQKITANGSMVNVRVHAASWNTDNVRIEKLIQTAHSIPLIQLVLKLIGVIMTMKLIPAIRLSKWYANLYQINQTVKIMAVNGKVMTKDAFFKREIVLYTRKMIVKNTSKIINNAFGSQKTTPVYSQRNVVSMNSKIKIFVCRYLIVSLMDRNAIVVFKPCFHLNK